MIRIAVDGMGGDFAPLEIVRGSIKALEELPDLSLIITGDETAINSIIGDSSVKSRIEVLHASQVITNNDHPAEVVRRKRDSSMHKAAECVKEGKAKAVVTAGSTGAFMAVCMFTLGRLKGVSRPAIGIPLPFEDGRQGILLDGGANAEITPREYLVFAMLGTKYISTLYGREAKAGLLNIGKEEEKGSRAVLEAHKLLKEKFPAFVGNVEPNEILKGIADAVICDGFAGNMVLKSIEGFVEILYSSLKKSFSKSLKSKIAGFLAKPILKEALKSYDYETIGGSPLLGLNGIAIKSHGRSKETAFKNAVKLAYELAKGDLISIFAKELENERFAD